MDEPIGMKGRTFKEDGSWVYLLVGSQPYIAKVSDEDFKKAVSGSAFEAWHVTIMGPKGPVYVPAVSGTLEPWYMNGAHCAAVAQVHPELAARMDDGIKKSLSSIVTAVSSQMPTSNKDASGKPRFTLVP